MLNPQLPNNGTSKNSNLVQMSNPAPPKKNPTTGETIPETHPQHTQKKRRKRRKGRRLMRRSFLQTSALRVALTGANQKCSSVGADGRRWKHLHRNRPCLCFTSTRCSTIVLPRFRCPMASSISAWFWSESFWLPKNVTWEDLERPPPGVEYPRVRHLLYALPLAVMVFLLRMLFERLVAKPCAHILHIQAGVPRRAQPNAVLEKVFQSKCPDTRQLEGLTKQLDWDQRKIERWFRVRRNQDRPGMQKKFCESMWRLTFYLGIFIYAVRHLWVSPWTWDTRKCWYNYPFQPLSPLPIRSQFTHYAAELSFYWSLMFSQFIDVKRKVSGPANPRSPPRGVRCRSGRLVMCAAKLANYAKYQRLCDGLFVVFSVSFFITRLVIYPFCVLVESWEIVGPYRSWWLLNGLLLVLQTLHVIWFYLIARIAVKAVFKGKVSWRRRVSESIDLNTHPPHTHTHTHTQSLGG
uniref:TLC domain-containing protein n=1 Tax=Gasterosteus aculeatus aculeatus TaxID=481459 RepID=A0AAQ4R6S8_GASAC